jgi:hypothetical protein
MSTRPEGAHIAGIRIDHGGTVPRERPSSAVGATLWRAQPTTGSRHGRPDYADGETGGAFADGFRSLEVDTA